MVPVGAIIRFPDVFDMGPAKVELDVLVTMRLVMVEVPADMIPPMVADPEVTRLLMLMVPRFVVPDTNRSPCIDRVDPGVVVPIPIL